jgi:hypothetical protein
VQKFITSLLAVAAVLAGILIVVLQSVPDDTVLSLEFAKALISLITAVLITGILGVVLGWHSARQARREERARALAGALQELKAGFERVRNAQFLLRSNPSARAFKEQVLRISEARGHLHKVQRERFVRNTPVRRKAQLMLNGLDELFDEYRCNYPDLTRAALAEDRAEREFLDGSRAELPAVPLLPPDKYRAVYTFIDEDKFVSGPFAQAYVEAKDDLEALLDNVDKSVRPVSASPSAPDKSDRGD